ncbi:MAG: ABC transporter permease [Candidatus Dormibacteria bacterium]
MARYILRRLIQALIVLFGVTVFVFVLLHLIPGGEARALLGPKATHQDILAMNRQLGLDKPIYVQYWVWIDGILHGNLGYSYKFNQNVSYILETHIPNTLVLMTTSYLIAFIIAIPLGVLQGVRHNKADDYALTGMSFLFYSMPPYWLGLVLILIFNVYLNWLPSTAPQGTVTLSSFNLQLFIGLALPVMTLALITIAQFSRYQRSAVLDNLVQDYVRTARAKGLSSFQTLRRHILRNSLIPIITLLGLSLPSLFAGALLTESIFNYPGMGWEFWQAAQASDYPTLLATVLIVATATLVGNFVADILYAVVDPRVRYS